MGSKPDSAAGTPKGKGKKPAVESAKVGSYAGLPKISQKSLFLALYAKFMSGEKRKDEDSEMVMGPQDLGTIANKQLLVVSRFLNNWFEERSAEDDETMGSQGWLEYL
jgi:anaphase-promoting complex subunit 8